MDWTPGATGPVAPNARIHGRREGLPYKENFCAAKRTIASVSPAIAHSPTTPTTSGRQPCFISSRTLVRSPTPANVKRNAQRDRFARSVDLRLRERARRGHRRDDQEPEHELRELLPQERALVADRLALVPPHPVQRVAEHDEADRRVARRLRQHGELARRRPNTARRPPWPRPCCRPPGRPRGRRRGRSSRARGRSSGNTNRLTAPSARIAAIAYDASSSSASMAPFAAMIADTPQIDEPIDSRLMSFGDSPNARPSAVISDDRRRQLDRHAREAHAAQLDDVAEHEADAEQHDAGLEPELVGVHAGAKDRRDADRVGDHQAEDDRPEHVFDVGQRQVVGPAVGGNRLLGQLAGVADDREEQVPGMSCAQRGRRRDGGGRIGSVVMRVTMGCPERCRS